LKNKKLNIDVVAFDAGGAELLASMVQHEVDNYNWRLITPNNSPARAIFERKRLSKLVCDNFEPEDVCHLWNKAKPDYLFCGTGSNGFELPFIKEAKHHEITSVAFLDHWINYRERFGYPESDWTDNKPDIFALSDNRAYALAERLNLGELVRIKNYYMADLLSELNLLESKNQNSKSLLFISEAIEEHCLTKYDDANFMGYTQTQVLTEILDNFHSLSDKLQFENINIRLHPAEDNNKFDSLIKNYPNRQITIERPGDKPLNESITSAKAVIGIQSMALLIAFLLKKPVISYIPIDLSCSLPLPDECCLHELDTVPKIETIPCFKADDGLSFYEKYPLDKMLSDVEKSSFERLGNY